MFRDPYAAPGDFPLGSLESRAAARALLGRCNITTVIVSTGLPWPRYESKPVEPPNTVAYYLAPDDSVVEVVCLESEAGKFAAHIRQTWSDGGEYHGNHLMTDLADIERVCRPQRARKQSVS